MKNIVKKIKEKKELAGIADSVVKDSLNAYLLKNKFDIKKLSKTDKKIVVSEVRSQLRRLSGQYQKSLKTKEDLSPKDLLNSHSSTHERINYYPELKSVIESINPKSILDLGCGLNPIALATKKVEYFASDIKEDELHIIDKHFKKNKIRGSTFVLDLRNINMELPVTDLCLIFKVLDILDVSSKKRNILAEKIIKKIRSKKILVSFATVKISGKKMNQPDRYWFEAILISQNLEFKKFSSDSEIFYFITK